MNLSPKNIFITGIPTSGKSYLAKKLSEKIGAKVVHLDDLRESLSTNETYKKWTNFYLDQDEETYLMKTTPEQKWQDLVNQSEGLWP
ncbi:zeta toxin family protein, partial [Candidatus Gracilibacteria bacterium]|nr:zeta toxin family protein [Candidatus Gracilibacteria bacterium]